MCKRCRAISVQCAGQSSISSNAQRAGKRYIMSFNVSLVIDSKAIVRIRKAAASYNSFNIGLASLQISNFRIGCRDFAFRRQAADCRRAGNVSIAINRCAAGRQFAFRRKASCC